MFIRAYLRASTKEQDATRAKAALDAFAKSKGQVIASYYIENESGATLARPELMRLIDDAHKGDVLLVEQVDRLARLNECDWNKLKKMLDEKEIAIVTPELPLSHSALGGGGITGVDAATAAIMRGLNTMMLDVLAITARKDYEDRRRRQAEGIEKAKAAGKYQDRKPRREDVARRAAVRKLLLAGNTYSEIQSALSCSRRLIADVSKQLKDEAVLRS